VLHRDVKPENVLLSPDGGAKLVDFGIARAAADITVTAPGQVVGSPHYLAPERLTGSLATASTDVYSVGVMLYQMLSGRFPFESDTPSALLVQQQLGCPTPLSDLHPGLPGWVDRVVRRALAPEPAARYRSAAEMREELSHLAESGYRETTTSLLALAAPPPGQRQPVAGRLPELRRLASPKYPVLAAMAVLASILILGSGVRDANTAEEQAVSPAGSALVSTATPLPAPALPAPARTAAPTATPVPKPTASVRQGDGSGESVSPAEARPRGGPPGLRNKPDKSEKKKRD
jgi:serine/threonine-protein kinase